MFYGMKPEAKPEQVKAERDRYHAALEAIVACQFDWQKTALAKEALKEAA